MDRARVALGARWEGESLKAECPVCGHERLYVQPPDRDGLPTFVCGRGCDWASEVAPALLRVGVPGELLRLGSRDPAVALPSASTWLDAWPTALATPKHAAFRRYLRTEVGLGARAIQRLGLGLARHGARWWLTVPVYDSDWVLRQIRYWDPFTGAKFWPYTGHGARWLLGAERAAESDPEDLVLYLEGESDYCAAAGAGALAVAGVAGATTVPADLSALAGRRVCVCFDNDAVGRAGARKQAAALLDAGATVWIADIATKAPEPGGDLRDWLIRGAGSPAALRQWTTEVAASEPVSAETLAAAVADDDALDRERQRRRVRRAVEAEEAFADWEAPPSSLDMAEELALADEPMNWTVENLHERGTNTLVVAQYKTGKTVLALNLLKRLVDGEDFLGFGTALPDDGRRVAWWNYELTSAQARRWVREMKFERAERMAHLALRGYPMPLQAEAVVGWAVTWLRERDVKCWVIDPFAEAFDGDENDNSVVRTWLQHLNEIKRRADVDDVFLVVHTGHAEAEEGRERARGASRLEGWKDVGWYYTKDPSSGSLRFLRAFGRDVDENNVAVAYDSATRLLTRDDTNDGLTRAQVVARKQSDRVAHIVAQAPGIKRGDLRARLGKGGNTEKDNWIATAVERGLIRTEDGKQNAVHHYPLAQPKLVLNP